MALNRKASAVWSGSLEQGEGKLSTASGGLKDTPYSFGTRFKNEPGTNPEELIGAAHAGCFSMALAGALANEGFDPKSIRSTATVTLDKAPAGWTILASRLSVEADVPGIDPDRFAELAEEAKANCPVSRLLDAEITLEAKLTQAGARKADISARQNMHT